MTVQAGFLLELQIVGFLMQMPKLQYCQCIIVFSLKKNSEPFSQYESYLYFRLSNECCEMDREILVASKLVETPPKPAVQLNLIEETDRVTPLDNSPTSHSTISTSSAETLLTAREISHVDQNISNSKSPVCSEKLENQISPVKVIDENQNVQNQSEAVKTLVFSLDADTGTYVTNNENLNTKECLSDENGGVANGGLVKAVYGLNEGNSGNKDVVDDQIINKKARHKRKSEMSYTSGEENRNSFEKSHDMSHDLEDKSHGWDDKSHDLDSDDGDGPLNTTDELIAASMGLIKLDSGDKEKSLSLVSDELDDSSKGSYSLGTDSSSNVLRDASRLYASGDRSDLVRDSMSSSDSRSASFNSHKTDPHEKDQVNFTNDKSNLEKFNSKVGITNQLNDSFINSDQSSDFENEIKEEDVSHVLRTSLNQFLSSRLSCNRTYEDSTNTSNLSGLKGNDSKVNGYGGNSSYAQKKYSTPLTNMSDFENSNNFSSPSLQSFEHHEKGLRYLTKSRNGSKSSDYSSQESVILPEGSFTGQCKHRDSSYLGGLYLFNHPISNFKKELI